MSKYQASFKNIKDIDYLIEIETENGSNNGTFLLSANPLTSTMDSDGKTMYAPIKCSGMTVSILTKDMPFDLYSGSVMGTKVNVKEGTRYIFKGFLTPCAYSMGFDAELEEVQLECVDGISALKEIPYSSSDKEIRPFINIIFNCLKKTNCFKTLYVTNSMQFTQSRNEAIFERIRVSESNFYEQKDYELQPDNDVAMSCYDVLFEIMQYMGCTLIADGEEVYILDYDAIRNSKNTYFKYEISGSTIGTKQQVTLSQSYHIKEGSYAESGSKVDLSETFNKLTVKDDFYKVETVNDGMDNAKNFINITASDDAYLREEIGKHDEGPYVYVDVVAPKGDRMELCTFRSMTSGSDRGWYHFNIFRFFKNPMIKTYHYRLSDNAKLTNGFFDTEMNYSSMWKSKGANVVGNFQEVFDAWEFVINGWASKYPKTKWATMTDKEKCDAYQELLGGHNITSKKLTNYIICNNPSENHIEHDKVKNFPYFTITKNVPSVFGGVDGYIVISGSLIRHTWDNCLFPHYSKVTEEIKETNCSIYKNEAYLWARLQWGNQYWKEEGNSPTLKGEWTTTPSYFKLYYGDPTKETKLRDWYNKELNFYDTCKYVWGETNESGYYIPAPNDGNLEGNIELTFYANKDTKGKQDRRGKKDKKNSYDAYPPRTILYKNIEIKLCFADDALNEDVASEDTYYTNEVENYLNINEGEEINCKICTFDDKTPSYSTTDYLEGTTSKYVDTLYHLATNISLRPEEHIIYKTINQYQEPKIIYTANLKNDIGFKPYMTLTDKTLSNKTFIIDTIQRDYRYNKADVSMIEKNNKYS